MIFNFYGLRACGAEEKFFIIFLKSMLIKLKLEEIIDALDALVITNSWELETEIEWACATDLMSEVLYYSRENSILITSLAKQQVVITADIANIRVVAFTRGKEPDTKTVEYAQAKNITLLITPYPMFTACGRLYRRGLKSCPEQI